MFKALVLLTTPYVKEFVPGLLGQEVDQFFYTGAYLQHKHMKNTYFEDTRRVDSSIVRVSAHKTMSTLAADNFSFRCGPRIMPSSNSSPAGSHRCMGYKDGRCRPR